MVAARETTLPELLEGSKQYQVPLYQRTYSWTVKQWSVSGRTSRSSPRTDGTRRPQRTSLDHWSLHLVPPTVQLGCRSSSWWMDNSG